MSRRRAIASRVKAGRTTSHAADANAGGLRDRRKRAPLELTRSAQPRQPMVPRGKRRGTHPRHTEAHEAAGCGTAPAAMNDRLRRDRWAMNGAPLTAVHAARAHQGATMDDGEETATRRGRDRSNGFTRSRRLSIVASKM